jgi:hypothetical protein
MAVRGASQSNVFTVGISLPTTDASGTPGNATINTPRGRFAFAASSSQVTITNSLVTATSTVLAVLTTHDAAVSSVEAVVVAAGSFVVHLNTVATGVTNCDIVVFN